jgi:phosphoribosylformylglycinamidine synthase
MDHMRLYSKLTDNIYLAFTINLDKYLNNSELYILLMLLGNETDASITDILDINYVCEISPKKMFKTTWGTNVIEILQRLNIHKILSIEKSRICINRIEPYDAMLEECSSSDSRDSSSSRIITKYIDINSLSDLGITEFEYYKQQFYGRGMTNVEEFDIRQSNSEHSRHWFFNGKYYIDGKIHSVSLMNLVKETNNHNFTSLVAFADNSSCIRGYKANLLISYKSLIDSKLAHIHPTHTAETHNFPTSISPFSGANTGVGGRIRDTIALGKGSNIISGYCVGALNPEEEFDYPYCLPMDLLIKASDGASDYGNKIGEPITMGFTRSFGKHIDGKRMEYVKPIMYCGGIGSVLEENLYKTKGELGMLLCQVGGPAYKIGLGGGSASSNRQTDKNRNSDFDAVQRGDPFMANKLVRFVRRCSDMKHGNPMLSIHDQGSGGMGNVLKELADGCGAFISLDAVNLGDPDMTSCEIWCAEYQEQCAFLTTPKHIALLKRIAYEENVPLRFVGLINNSNHIDVLNTKDYISTPAIFNVGDDIPRKTYNFTQRPVPQTRPLPETNTDFMEILAHVLGDVDVGCKKFLTNKVDRSVSGLIAQQQCIGPHHTPLSDYAITKLSYGDLRGVATSIGERPYIGITNVGDMVNMALGEMLTNLCLVNITHFKDIKILGNWMWSNNIEGNQYLLYEAVKTLTNSLMMLGIGIDGGKDSLSMNTEHAGETIMSPNSVVLSSYVLCDNIYAKLTPEFKLPGNYIVVIPLSTLTRLGGSIYAKTMDIMDDVIETPNFEDIPIFEHKFNILQKGIRDGIFVSGHDISDGGLITTLIEMCISSGYGFEGSKPEASGSSAVADLFNEELGLVYEVPPEKMSLLRQYTDKTFNINIIGNVTNSTRFKLYYGDSIIIDEEKQTLLDMWQKQSAEIEMKQCDRECVREEYFRKSNFAPPQYIWHTVHAVKTTKQEPCVLVLREEGSNGDKELIACFHDCCFIVYEMNMRQLLNSVDILERVNGIAFCGGFSFSDTLGSATGWAAVIKETPRLNDAFTQFYNRPDTFSLGICNGCQLMSKMRWIPECNITTNNSGRFESRYCTIKVNKKNNCIFTKGMGDTTFGMWVAHKEGKMTVRAQTMALSYCDNDGQITTRYPENPNGSEFGCAGVSSANGRHLAMMPHPERSFYRWQMPWLPDKYPTNTNYTPWRQLFTNAYSWVLKNKNINN